MGTSNSFQSIKQQALKNRETKLQSQMLEMKNCFQKYQITQEKAIKIASFNVHEIVQKLNIKQLTSQEILCGLVYRCSTVGKQLNFFTATNFIWALSTAKICDQKRRQANKKNWTFEDGQFNDQIFFPPLFGIPISIKDVFHVQSMTTTLGLCSKGMNYQPQSPLIKCLKNSGMIPFIKTNIPQFGMTCQTVNNLWGRTLNPWNKKRTVGGSSGGEGAAISGRCSLIGLGSDIGGSIRIPSQFCGIFGLKPSSRRISSAYHAQLSRALHSFAKIIPLCLGPLGKSARDLALFMDVVTHQQFYQQMHDPYTKIIPFNSKVFLNVQNGNIKWKIGIINMIKDVKPSLATERAISFTRDLLTKEGHEIVNIQIPKETQVIREFVGEYALSMEILRETLKGEQPIKQYKTALQMSSLNFIFHFLLSTASKKWMPRIHKYFLQKKINKTIFEYQNHVGQINQLKNIWIQYWKHHQLDFVICPGLGCQAFPHGMSEELGLACFYTTIWNVLDMTAGALPVTVVKQNQQIYDCQYDDIATKLLKKVAEESQGLPAGIQVIGLPYEEEKVLGFMSYLQKKIKFYQKHPLPNI